MKQQARYEALDCLRGVAAIGVMLFHFSIIGLPIAHHGYLAVDLFFVLSGFVMSHAYFDRLAKMNFYEFIKFRLIRIIPLSAFGLLVGTIYFVLRYLSQSQSQYGISDIIFGSMFNLFLMPKPWITPSPTDTIFTTNTPLWSLSLEVIVNFIWALFLFRIKINYIFILLFSSAGVLAVSSFMNGSADIGATWPTYFGGVSRAVFGFFAGSVLWRYKPKADKSLIYLIISTASLIFIIFLPDLGPLFDVLIITVIFPFLIYMTCNVDCRIEHPFFKFIGNLSYPLYVIHVPVLHFFVGISKTFKIDQKLYLVAVIAFISCIVFAIALDLFYDKPCRKALIKRIFP